MLPGKQKNELDFERPSQKRLVKWRAVLHVSYSSLSEKPSPNLAVLVAIHRVFFWSQCTAICPRCYYCTKIIRWISSIIRLGVVMVIFYFFLLCPGFKRTVTILIFHLHVLSRDWTFFYPLRDIFELVFQHHHRQTYVNRWLTETVVLLVLGQTDDILWLHCYSLISLFGRNMRIAFVSNVYGTVNKQKIYLRQLFKNKKELINFYNFCHVVKYCRLSIKRTKPKTKEKNEKVLLALTDKQSSISFLSPEKF